jgi:hypothetical protein
MVTVATRPTAKAPHLLQNVNWNVIALKVFQLDMILLKAVVALLTKNPF